MKWTSNDKILSEYNEFLVEIGCPQEGSIDSVITTGKQKNGKWSISDGQATWCDIEEDKVMEIFNYLVKSGSGRFYTG